MFPSPRFWPPTSDITLVDHLLPGKMAQAKAISFIRNILASPRYGLTEADFGNLTAHSWRHLLPSLTDYAQCDPQEQLMVGAWKASGDERAVARNARKAGAMPLRYSAVKPIAQASVKTRLRVGLLLALKKYRERHSTTSATAPSLEELPPYWPHKGVVAIATKQFLEACEAGLQLVAMTQEPIADVDPTGSSSSSSSSESSEAAPSDDCLVQVAWLRSKGPSGRLHIKGVDGATLCGRILRDPEEGDTLLQAIDRNAKWSPRCWCLLTDLQRDKWSMMLRE